MYLSKILTFQISFIFKNTLYIEYLWNPAAIKNIDVIQHDYSYFVIRFFSKQYSNGFHFIHLIIIEQRKVAVIF